MTAAGSVAGGGIDDDPTEATRLDEDAASSMLDAASSDLAVAVGSSSIPPPATDTAAVTVAAAALLATTSRPPSSINADVPATAMVTTVAGIANNARYDPATNVDGGPSPAALGDDADKGTGNTLVQVAVMSIISKDAKSSLLAYFKGENWPLNKTLYLPGPVQCHSSIQHASR